MSKLLGEEADNLRHVLVYWKDSAELQHYAAKLRERAAAFVSAAEDVDKRIKELADEKVALEAAPTQPIKTP